MRNVLGERNKSNLLKISVVSETAPHDPAAASAVGPAWDTERPGLL